MWRYFLLINHSPDILKMQHFCLLRYTSQETWWLGRYIPYFNRPKHRYLYIHESIKTPNSTLIFSAGWTWWGCLMSANAKLEKQSLSTQYPPIGLTTQASSNLVALAFRPVFEPWTSRLGVQSCHHYITEPPFFKFWISCFNFKF